MEQYFIASPDVVCTASKQRIHLYANGESMIEFEVATKLTKLYEVEGMPEGSDKKMVVSSVNELGDKLSSVKLSSKVVSRVDEGEATADSKDVPIHVGAIKTETQHSQVSMMTMHLNVNKQIFLIINTYS